MKQSIREIYYDAELHIQAYCLRGQVPDFPNHFHDHYTIGTIREGNRSLSCKNREYALGKGDVNLFNPGDNHACRACGDGKFFFCGLNIPVSVMQKLSKELTGCDKPPVFSENVLRDKELALSVTKLYDMILQDSREFEKEELFYFLAQALFTRFSLPSSALPARGEETERARRYIQQHYAEHLTLDDLCRCAGLSKSSLLRTFSKAYGITPYRYLETVRINQAKALLEQGVAPAEAALQTGFCDQSHFTNYFTSFIGVAPGVYRDIFLPRPGGKGNAGQA